MLFLPLGHKISPEFPFYPKSKRIILRFSVVVVRLHTLAHHLVSKLKGITVEFSSIEDAPDKPLPREIAYSFAPKSPAGRPTSFTVEIAQKILEFVAGGSFMTSAAQQVGLDVQTVAGWLKRGLGDKAVGLDTQFGRFAEAFAQAQAAAENSAVAALQRGGDGKYKDWRAQAWWLERRHKERWSLPKEQGNQGISLTLSNEQLAALGDALKAAAAATISLTAEPDKKPG